LKIIIPVILLMRRKFSRRLSASPAIIRALSWSATLNLNRAANITSLPLFGVAHVAYIPAKRVVGLSKIARIVDIYARRMQVQERMTMDIAKALEEHLKPKGLAILLDAQHFCMKVRGVHKNNASTITTHFSGAYRKDDDLREEFLMQIRGSDR
jgi:GTP cyclohydrolase I